MRIARIEAIAYGAIAGRVVEPEPGLTVIHGPNESGKSSTMQLIRGVLFGFPRLQGEGPRREPKGGGQRAGRVDIVTDDGRRLRIERAGSSLTVTDHEGVPVGDVAFAHALGIASAELFDRVQTFDAKDLAWMGLLDDPSVRAGVLASAVLGGGAGAGPVLEGLQKRADALYLRQGEKQPYAHALKQATAARRALRDAEREAGTVERSSDAIAEAEQRVDAAHEQLVVATRELQRLERLLELREALRALSALEAPADGGVEEPTAATLSTFRALLGDVPTAVEARRRAEQLLSDAADEDARAQAGRSHLGLAATAAVPALGDEAALRTAAETVREAEREATRLGDAARTLATHVPIVVEPSSATPRRGLGAALIVISLLAIGAGWAISITATILGGILGVAVGAALLGGLIGSRTGRSTATATASDQQRPTAEQALELAEQARAAWREALGGLGLLGELRSDQLDDILTTLATIRTAEQAAARAGALAETEATAAAEIAARAAAALMASGVEPPTELGQLRDTIDRTLHQLEEQRAQAAAGRNELQAWQDRQALAQRRVDELSLDDDALVAAAQALDLELTDAQRTVLEQQVAVASEEHAAALEARGGTRALLANAEDSSDLASLAQAAADAEADLRAVADQWLTLQLAHDLVESARDRFVAEHQPGVFARAAQQIETATNGSWVSVRMPDGEKAGARSEIIAADGTTTPFTELSEGTVGLVYLCLRAGLVDELHDDGGAELPVLMDDVLTNLDPERRAGAAAVIADLATRHQVLYFTCHPEQVQALRDANPGLTEIELQRLV